MNFGFPTHEMKVQDQQLFPRFHCSAVIAFAQLEQNVKHKRPFNSQSEEVSKQGGQEGYQMTDQATKVRGFVQSQTNA